MEGLCDTGTAIPHAFIRADLIAYENHLRTIGCANQCTGSWKRTNVVLSSRAQSIGNLRGAWLAKTHVASYTGLDCKPEIQIREVSPTQSTVCTIRAQTGIWSACSSFHCIHRRTGTLATSVTCQHGRLGKMFSRCSSRNEDRSKS